MNTLRSAKDPNAMLMQIASTNPQLKEILDATANGKSPKDLFYERAKEMGVDPNDILQYLK